jgi:hypothetical protein
MSENPSEHNNDEERLPKTRSQLGGGNWIPPILVTGPESGDDDDFQKAYSEYVAQYVEINRRLREIAPLLCARVGQRSYWLSGRHIAGPAGLVSRANGCFWANGHAGRTMGP